MPFARGEAARVFAIDIAFASKSPGVAAVPSLRSAHPRLRVAAPCAPSRELLLSEFFAAHAALRAAITPGGRRLGGTQASRRTETAGLEGHSHELGTAPEPRVRDRD